LGPEVEEFESNVASYLGVKHAVGVNSGTDALLISLRAMGIGEGDEVITTAMSYFATAESISHTGARPVFADIDSKTFNINPNDIEHRINKHTKAILPVHLFGRPAEMIKIMEISQRHGLKILEDCAQSFGATVKAGLNAKTPKQTGSIGNAGAFSFFPSKNLGGIGDGGLIATNDDKIAGEARILKAHGSAKKYFNEKLGYNSRLDTVQAAFLNLKLKHIDELNQMRREVAEFYNNGLAGVKDVQCPAITEGNVFHQYTIRVLHGKRDQLRHYLKENGISSNIYFPLPMNELKVYENDNYPVLPAAHSMAQESLSLPIWPHIEFEKLERVIKAIRFFCNT
jgi:dTDP-4-amino-4,6-dideoxygalactose transaminase